MNHIFLAALLGATIADASDAPASREALPAFLTILKEHRLGPWLASRSPCREWSVRNFRAETLFVASLPVHDSDCQESDPGDRFLFTWPTRKVFLVVGEGRVPLETLDSLLARTKEEDVLAEERTYPGVTLRRSRLFPGAGETSDPGPILKDPYLDEEQAGAILLMGGRLPKDRIAPIQRQFEWRSRVWVVDSGVVAVRGKGRLMQSLEKRIRGRLESLAPVSWPLGKPGSGHFSLKLRLDTAGKADSVEMIQTTPGLEFLRDPLMDWARGLNVRQGSIEPCWIRLKLAAEARLVRTVPDSLWKPATVELVESKDGRFEIRQNP